MKSNKVVPLPGLSQRNSGLRTRIKNIIDGKVVTISMAIVTLFVLFGDDVRLVATSKEADQGFFVSFMICLVLFVVELIANSIFVEDYKFSFFFWLDVIATISLLPDIPYLRDPLLDLFMGSMYNVEVDLNTTAQRDTVTEAYTSQTIRSIRFIRLVRIVKLYKYFNKSNEEETQTEENSGDMNPQSLGKRLSDITTRRVIIGVLLMLVLIPLLDAPETDNATYYGLQQLFWAGRSACSDPDYFGCSPNSKPFVNQKGWEDMVYFYSSSSQKSSGEDSRFPLLWLRVPDFTAEGKVQDITSVPNWDSDPDCSGKSVPSECSLRDQEMKLIIYAPETCIDEDLAGCEEIQAYARFDMQSFVRQEAQMNIIITIFVGLILAVASVTFAYDTQKIVIKPVTKMVKIIQNLADDPLKLSEKQAIETAQTSILEETIDKIGVLLQMAFGQKGSEIIGEMLCSYETYMNEPGERLHYVISLCEIEYFPEIIDAIQEEVLVFVNKIGKIVHSCSHRWEGVSCDVNMGRFLMLWEENRATEALLAMIKISAELHRAADITAYKTNPRIIPKFGENYYVNVLMALDVGWVVQGPVGSSIKVDPGYISPRLSLCELLIKSTEEFGVPLVFTESFFEILDEKAQVSCRKIDSILTDMTKEPFGLYTFDLVEEVPLPDQKREADARQDYDLRRLGDPIFTSDVSHIPMTTSILFDLDHDVNSMLKAVSPQFLDFFNKGLQAYQSGYWQDALLYIDRALEVKPADGPSLSLKRLIDAYSAKPPQEWSGFRKL